MASQDKPVLVVVGVGGMGQSIARRLGTGKTVLLADFNEDTLNGVVNTLKGDGFDVHAQVVDVSKPESLAALASAAAGLGPVMQVAHTAGLSPTQAPVGAILAVDLVGVAQSLDAFGEVIAQGGAGVVIASMAGQTAQPLTPEQERALASTPTGELAGLDFASEPAVADPGQAYGLAKRANQLRVQAASVAWGKRGARINSISPGIISTPMGQQELAGRSGGFMRAMIGASGTGRIGTPEDIAAAAAFLLSPEATFITGTDLLVDGGVIAALRNGALQMPH
ncbi:MAG: SDR family oxidoreductase [Propionibacteriaceae bacterium]|nr:SDR family oxidoreductase [Propionibacteriaceae bacterium]